MSESTPQDVAEVVDDALITQVKAQAGPRAIIDHQYSAAALARIARN